MASAEQASGSSENQSSLVAPCNTAEDAAQDCESQQSPEADKRPCTTVDLLRPHTEFLGLLKEAGATQEIFTKKEICFYLKEYISSRQLYDPWDPRVVYCRGDALANVFGVEHFTIEEVLELITKNSSPQEPYPRRKCPQSSLAQHQNRQLQYEAQRQFPNTRVRRVSHTITLSSDKERDTVGHGSEGPTRVASDSELHQTKQSENQNRRRRTLTGSVTPELNISIAEALREAQHRKRKRRQRHRGLQSSESTDGGARSEQERCRQSSFSIVLAQQEGQRSPSSQPWFFRVQVDDSDESEVLSIQSKETVVVKDSSDDLWFIEDSDQISLEMSDGGFSLEIQSNTSELNFSEYEVQSLSSETVQEGNSDTSEDIVVVCHDSDIEFWADSSDLESETSDNDSNSDLDQWRCGECDMDNTATQGHCGRCWTERPEWLPEQTPEQTGSKPPLPRSTSAPCDTENKQSSSSPEHHSLSRPVKRRKRNSSVTAAKGASSMVPQETLECQPSLEAQEITSVSQTTGSEPPGMVRTGKSPSQENVGNISYDSVEEALATLPMPNVSMPVSSQTASSCCRLRSPTALLKASSCQQQVQQHQGRVSNSQHLLVAADGIDNTDSVTTSVNPPHITGLPSSEINLNASGKEDVHCHELGHPTACNGAAVTPAELPQPKVLLPPTQPHASGSHTNSPLCALSSASDDTSLVLKPSSITRSDSYNPDTCTVNLSDQEITLSIADGSTLPQPRVGMPVVVPPDHADGFGDRISLSRDDSGFYDSQLSKISLDVPCDAKSSLDSPKRSTNNLFGSGEQFSGVEAVSTRKGKLASLVRKDSGFGDMPYTDTGQPSESKESEENTEFQHKHSIASQFLHGLSSAALQSGSVEKTETLKNFETHDMVSKSLSEAVSQQKLTPLPIAGGSGSVFSTVRPEQHSRTNSSSSQPVTGGDEQAQQRRAVKEGFSDLCMICFGAPKDASIIHGKSGHQVCCYKCAKCLRRRGKPCPVCRRTIDKVVRNFIL